LCEVSAHKQVRRLKENPMAHIAQNIWISLTGVVINRMKPKCFRMVVILEDK
jgi:hypothetical protein